MTNPTSIRIAVVGMGYVGLTTAVALAKLGHRVTGIDIDCARVAGLKRGVVPIHEPGLQAALPDTDIEFTVSMREALASEPEIVMIAVQTPAEAGRASDTSFIEQAARDVGRELIAPALLVMRSTVPPGTTRRMGEIASDAFGTSLPVASNPEFLVEGRAFEAFMNPDRVVIGVDDERAASLMTSVYAKLNARLVLTDIATAELSKYAANAYLATQVSFINEIARLAEAAGADIATITRVLKMDARIGERAYLDAGVGFGGSCLPKDLRTLEATASALGVDMKLARAVESVNDDRLDAVVEKVRASLGGLAGRRVAVWGLAFKPGTDDVRDSQAVKIVQRLAAAGADVRAYDPLVRTVPTAAVAVEDDAFAAADGAEALVVLMRAPAFANADLATLRRVMRDPLIVDACNVFDATAVRDAGFRYAGVADPPPTPARPAEFTTIGEAR